MVSEPNTLYPANGTADDLLSILARAEERRYRRGGIVVPRKTAGGRRTVEPIVNAAGVAGGWAMRLLPSTFSYSLQDKLLKAVAAGSVLPFDASAPGIEGARRLCAELEQETGRRPALVAVLSHPPVTPEWLNLNVEMSRQAVLALRLMRGRSCRPRMVVAVDPYALDMLPLAQEAAYAGFMGTCHLGFDRLAHGRTWPSRLAVGPTSWERLPWRISKILSRGGEMSMVLAGGIPTTARVIYTVREFLMRLRRRRPRGMLPVEFSRRLGEARPDFSRFLESGFIGPGMRRSAWRTVEAWVAARMVGEWPPDDGDGMAALEGGRVTEGLRDVLRAVAAALEIQEPEFREALAALEEEFARETPYRERFFRFLARRIVARGTPVLLLPLSHRVESRPDGSQALRLDWGRPAELKAENVGCFAREFVRSHYP